MVDNYTDTVDALLTSVSNGVGGAARTVQRSLDRMASTISPDDGGTSEDEGAADDSQVRRRVRTETAAGKGSPAP